MAARVSVKPRPCGDCTLCCRLMRVDELDKGVNQWCRHCKDGARCTIHRTRPKVCRDFQCQWTLLPQLSDELRPDKSRVILTIMMTEAGEEVVIAIVDPRHSGAHERSPMKDLLDDYVRKGIGVVVQRSESDQTREFMVLNDWPYERVMEIARNVRRP